MLQAKLSVYKKNLGTKTTGETVGLGTPKPAKAPAAPKPAAPAAPQPFNAAYDSKVNAITTGLNDTLGNIGYDQGRLVQRYGFDDPTSFGLAADPFSQAKMLQRAYEQRQRGNTNSYAAQGQLYSGALQRQQANTTFDYQRDEHSARTSYEDLMRGLAERRTAAGTGAAQDIADAEWDRLQSNLNVPIDPALVAPEPRPKRRKKGKKK